MEIHVRKTGVAVLVVVVLALGAGGTLSAKPAGVFDVEVTLLEASQWDGGGYLWRYQVCASPATNRGLSHWSLSICDPENSWNLGEDDMLYFDLSFFSGSDPYYFTSGAGVNYVVEFGTDPKTGVKGIKFEYDDADGSQIGDGLTCDTFAFRLTEQFEVVSRGWGAKGGQELDFGSVSGPACVPATPPPPTPPPVPEPATFLLLGLGLIGGAVARRRGLRR